MARRRQVLTFTGSPTRDGAALAESLARAARAQVTVGGFLIYAVDRDEDVLVDDTLKYVDVVGTEVIGSTDGPDDLAELVGALDAHEVTDVMCMCTGDLAIEFFDADGTLVDVVRLDLPSRIEWPRWPGKAEVVAPDKLRVWLEKHAIPGAVGLA